MARPKKINVADLQTPIEVVPELVETKEDVKAIRTPQVTTSHIEVNKVKLANKVTGKIIAMAVDERIANKLVKSNPNIKIVQ